LHTDVFHVWCGYAADASVLKFAGYVPVRNL